MSTRAAASGKKAATSWVVLVVLIALLVLHNDFWSWNDPTRVLGLPIGLFYHVAYCGAVSVVFWWIVALRKGTGQ